MIDSISIKNFKKHEDIHVQFTPGLNVIVGKNYSGKTSVLQAILVALFGTSILTGTGKALVRKGQDTFYIDMKFGRYRIWRSISHGEMYRDGELIASGFLHINRMIQKVLGVNKGSFLRVNFVAQKRAEFMVNANEKELNTLLESVSGYDTVATVLEKLKPMRATIEGRLSNLNIEEAQALLPEWKVLNHDAVLLKDKLLSARVAVEKLQLRSAKTSNELAEAERHNSRVFSMQREKETALENIRQVNEEIAMLEKQVEILDGYMYSDTNDLLKYEAELEKAEKDNLLMEQLHALRMKLAQMPREEVSPDQLKAAKDKMDRLRYSVDELSKVEKQSVCPKCMRPLEDISLLLKELEEKSSLYVAAKSEYEAAYKCWQTWELKRQINEIDSKNPMQHDLSRLKLKVVQLRELHGKRVQSERETPLIQEKIALLNSRLLALEKQSRMEIPPLRSALELGESLKLIQKDLEEAQEAATLLLSRYQYALGRRKEVRSRINAIFKAIKKMRLDRKKLEIITKLEAYLKESRTRVIGGLWDSVMAKASEFSGEILNAPIRIVDGELFLDDMPIALCSGFQRSVVGLGLQVGISESSPNRFFLMDEPTADADDENSLILASALSRTGDQVIMVSHRTFDASVANNVIDMVG